MSRAQTSRNVARSMALATTAVLALGALGAPALADPGKGRGVGQSASAPGQAKGPSKAPAETGKGRPASAGEGKGRDDQQGKGQGKGRGPQSATPPAHSAAGGQGKPAGAPAEGSAVGDSPAKGHGKDGSPAGSPPGNNGTVKIAPYGAVDSIPNNTPHPGCSFQVEWYGFDEGQDVISTVSFAMQAPTGDATLSVAGDTSVFVGGSPGNGAGNGGLDGVETYTLSFDGEPHPKQGYHVRLTVSTPRSNGNDTKTKVFWVEECSPGGTGVDGAPATGGVGTDGSGSDGSGSDGARSDGAGAVEAGTDASGAQATVPGATRPGEAAGGRSVAAGSATAAVPTSVDAGLSEGAWTRSILPLGVVALGALLALAALVRRRRDQA